MQRPAVAHLRVAAYAFSFSSSRRDVPMRAVFMRSWPSRYLATVQPAPSSCTRFSTGTSTPSKNTSFTSCPPSMSASGRTVMPGVLHVDQQERDALLLAAPIRGSVRTRQKIQSAKCASVVQIFWPSTT